jgi:hypothetical protein
MKSALLAIQLTVAALSTAFGQQPPFPQSLPSNTVIGNLSPVTAPARAIAVASLQAVILSASETPVADVNYSVVAADRNIVYTSLTVTRTVSLLPAASYLSGTRIYVFDRSGAASSTVKVIVSPSGSDVINGGAGGASADAVIGAYAVSVLESDGISKWNIAYFFSTGISPTLTGNWTFQPTTGNAVTITMPTAVPGTILGLKVTNLASGSPSAGSQQATNTVTLTDSSTNATGSIAAFQSQYTATGTASQGNGIGLLGVATTSANTNTFYGLGVQGQCQAAHTATGPTGLGGAGQCTGGNFLGALGINATGYSSVFGLEVNLSVKPTGGNAPKFKAGALFALNSGDAARGATIDTAIAISANNASITWKNGILFGNMAGTTAFGTDSTIIASTGAQQVNTFIDFSSYTCSGGNKINFNQFAVDCSDNVFVASASAYAWQGASRISSPGNGVILLSNNTVTTFSRLQLGGTTSSFPAIKRNAAAINFRLADDSADAAITASSITAASYVATSAFAMNGGSVLTSTTDGIWQMTNNAGTGFTRLILGTNDASGLSIVKSGTTAKFRTGADGADVGITAGASTFSGALTYGGVTLNNAVTGTGNMVLATSPSLTTPSLGAATATSGGSFEISFFSLSGTASDTPVLNFTVIKGVAS